MFHKGGLHFKKPGLCRTGKLRSGLALWLVSCELPGSCDKLRKILISVVWRICVNIMSSKLKSLSDHGDVPGCTYLLSWSICCLHWLRSHRETTDSRRWRFFGAETLGITKKRATSGWDQTFPRRWHYSGGFWSGMVWVWRMDDDVGGLNWECQC